MLPKLLNTYRDDELSVYSAMKLGIRRDNGTILDNITMDNYSMKNTTINHKKKYSLPLKLINCSPHDTLTQLKTNEKGLNKKQVKERLKQYGKNKIVGEMIPAWYVQLAKAFITPFNFILCIICLVSLSTDISFKSVIILTIMILFSTLLRFWQEFRSTQATEKLKTWFTLLFLC